MRQRRPADGHVRPAAAPGGGSSRDRTPRRHRGGFGHHGGDADQGNVALALLCNTLPTGAILVVLITVLGPISGAQFNPAVTLVFTGKRELKPFFM